MHHYTPPRPITAAMQETYGAAEIELDDAPRDYGRANSKPFGRTSLPHGVARPVAGLRPDLVDVYRAVELDDVRAGM